MMGLLHSIHIRVEIRFRQLRPMDNITSLHWNRIGISIKEVTDVMMWWYGIAFQMEHMEVLLMMHVMIIISIVRVMLFIQAPDIVISIRQMKYSCLSMRQLLLQMLRQLNRKYLLLKALIRQLRRKLPNITQLISQYGAKKQIHLSRIWSYTST